MSTLNEALTKTDVTPYLESSVFDQSPNSRFAIGILAVADRPLKGLESEYRSYFDLRRNVYVDETGQLSPSEIQEDGTDRDVDDARSVAFGAFENLGEGQIRTVGALRLIMKGFGEDAANPRELPVEEFCPDVFKLPAPYNSTEVSRLISRHETARVQSLLSWNIYSAGLAYIANHDLGPTYAVIEPWLERYLNATVPISRIGEPRYVEHYQDSNLPIEVHTDKFMASVEAKYPGKLDDMRQHEGELSFFGRAAAHAVVRSQLDVVEG